MNGFRYTLKANFNKKCIVCGNKFKACRISARFCTIKCRNAFHYLKGKKRVRKDGKTIKSHKKVCISCGKVFVNINNLRKYCSEFCSYQASKLRSKDGMAKTRERRAKND